MHYLLHIVLLSIHDIQLNNNSSHNLALIEKLLVNYYCFSYLISIDDFLETFYHDFYHYTTNLKRVNFIIVIFIKFTLPSISELWNLYSDVIAISLLSQLICL